MATPEKHGLAKQFTRLIVLSGLASFLLLGFLQVVLNKGLRLYFDQPEVQTKASDLHRREQAFQHRHQKAHRLDAEPSL